MTVEQTATLDGIVDLALDVPCVCDAVRYPGTGKWHPRGGRSLMYAVCGDFLTPLAPGARSERLPLSQTALEDRCKTCWKDVTP